MSIAFLQRSFTQSSLLFKRLAANFLSSASREQAVCDVASPLHTCSRLQQPVARVYTFFGFIKFFFTFLFSLFLFRFVIGIRSLHIFKKADRFFLFVLNLLLYTFSQFW